MINSLVPQMCECKWSHKIIIIDNIKICGLLCVAIWWTIIDSFSNPAMLAYSCNYSGPIDNKLNNNWNLLLFLQIAGLGCMGVGLWMAIDPDVKAYFVLFRRDPGDDLLVAGVACFIVVGLLLCGVGALGCFGAMTGRKALLILVSCYKFLYTVKQLIFGVNLS